MTTSATRKLNHRAALSRRRTRDHRPHELTGGVRLRVLGLVMLGSTLSVVTLGAVSVLERTLGVEEAAAVASSTQHTEHHAPAPPRPVLGPIEASGPDARVRLEASAADGAPGAAAAIPVGQKVLLTFQLADPASGQPLTGMAPKATLESAVAAPTNPYGPADAGDPFDARVTFVLVSGAGDLGVVESDGEGGHRHQPGASLTRTTGSSFAAVVKLPDASLDAAADASGRYVFASVPDKNQVAVVDTLTRRLEHSLPVGKSPFHIAVEPGGARVWVGNDGDGSVTAIDTQSHDTRTLPVGAGHHDFAFSADGRLAFVSNADSGIVSAIDTDQARVLMEAPAGRAPHGLDVAGDRLFVADEAGGTILAFAIGDRQLTPLATIPAGAGTTRVRVEPHTGLGVATNRAANSLTIFDARTLEVRRTVPAGRGPDDVAFIEDYAVARNSLSPDVTFVNLTNPEIADEVPIGSLPYLDAPHPGVHARLFVNAAGDQVLVPNPAEGQLYSLHVMMGRPMVMDQTKVDRGSEVLVSPASQVLEIRPGTYQRVVRFGVAGPHTLTIQPGDGRSAIDIPLDVVAPRALRPWQVTAIAPESAYVAGQEALVRFEVREKQSGAPDDALRDAMITTYQFAPGQAPWQRVLPAENVGQGLYQARVTFPASGTFFATLSSLPAGLSPGDAVATPIDVAAAP